MSEERGHQVDLYDKCYASKDGIFNKRFDFITATEVIEHLRDPMVEFKRLASTLRMGGYIALMTNLLTEETDFKSWYYKKDPSHIGFFNIQYFIYIAKDLNFEFCIYSERVIFLKKLG